VYKDGRKHLDADALSRNPVDFGDLRSDFKNMYKLDVSSPEIIKILSNVDFKLAQREDKKLKPIIDSLINVEDKDSHYESPFSINYSLQNDVLYRINSDENGRLWRLVIPSKLVKPLLDEIHINSMGHLGLAKTWYTIKSRFYWPSMFPILRRYIQGCSKCQFFNRRTIVTPGPMQIMEPPPQPFYRVGIDFIGPFPKTKSHKYEYICVVSDHLTRYIEAWPCRNITAKCAIDVLEKYVIFRHSCPKEIVLDQGTSFTADEFQNFAQKYIVLKFTSPYHPNTNGLVERNNATIKTIISKFVHENHRDWDVYLQKAVFAYNNSKHAVTKYTPFFLLHGHESFLPCDAVFPTVLKYIDDDEPNKREIRINYAVQEAYNNTLNFQRQCKSKFDLSHPPVVFAPGEKVKLANFRAKPGRVRKWLAKWTGPYIVVKHTGPVNCKIYNPNPKAHKQFQVVSVRHLQHYYDEMKLDLNVEYEIDESQLPDDILKPDSDIKCRKPIMNPKSFLSVSEVEKKPSKKPSRTPHNSRRNSEILFPPEIVEESEVES